MLPNSRRQIYSSYGIVRSDIQRVVLLITILWAIPGSLLANGPRSKYESFEDSVYNTLNKQQRIAQLISISLKDFYDNNLRNEALTIGKNYRIGNFVLKNGHRDAVEDWITQIKNQSFHTPSFTVSTDELFEVPIDGYPYATIPLQIGSLSSDSLIQKLGELAGNFFIKLGFDYFEVKPDSWSQKEEKYALSYLQGLKKSGLGLILGNPSDPDLKILLPENFNASSELFDAVHWDNFNPIGLKTDKNNWAHKFQNKSKFNGLYVSDLSNKKSINVNEVSDRLNYNSDVIVLPVINASTLQNLSYLVSGKHVKRKHITRKVKKVVRVYQRTKTHKQKSSYPPPSTFNWAATNHNVHTNSVVLLNDDQNLVPLKDLGDISVASISQNDQIGRVFRNYLKRYHRVADYTFEHLRENEKQAINQLNHFDLILAYLPDDMEGDLLSDHLRSLNEISKLTKVIIISSGNQIEHINSTAFDALFWTPSYSAYYAGILPQSIFGAEPINGRLPNEYRNDEIAHITSTTHSLDRLKYAAPEVLNINYADLKAVDILIKDAIDIGAIPGCQILMAKNGTVVYNKSYGYFTYDSLIKVENESVYDIASITKVAATVPSLMYLHERDLISVDRSLAEFDPYYEGTNKENILLKDVLMHQAGFKSHLPFWRNAKVDEHSNDFRFKVPRRKRRVYGKRYLNINWNDSIKSWITQSSLIRKKGKPNFPYYYSDLGFMLLKDLVEIKLDQGINEFLRFNFFDPLGMDRTYYQPLCQLPQDEIAPTEEDDYFRNKLIWGTVHDQNAALSEGIGGHAGLFSSANDLAKYMQMFLQKGNYGGVQYFKPETVEMFTSRHSENNRRALGWDTPDNIVGNASKYASSQSFGHTGFTGTSVWADPEYEFIYVFLSNRIHPDIGNYKLIEKNIRTTIQDIMYESFLKNKDTNK